MSIKNLLKKSKTIRFLYYKCYKKMTKNKVVNFSTFSINECRKLLIQFDFNKNKTKRLNLLVPSLQQTDIYGGISSALSIFLSIVEQGKFRARIIITDRKINLHSIYVPKNFNVQTKLNCDLNNLIIDCSDRSKNILKIDDNDIFLATAWWTAFILEDVIISQQKAFNKQYILLYLIQDYEPGFYPFSTRFSYAESTYKMNIKICAIFNSIELEKYFISNKYNFYKSIHINPIFNKILEEKITKDEILSKKKIILIYGRPETPRNAFEAIIESLTMWSETYDKCKEWEIFSVGSFHNSVKLKNGVHIKCLGKLNLNEYSEILKTASIGISLMVSPHPSYPPLEMATYGLNTITNDFGITKKMSYFSNNIYTISKIHPKIIGPLIIDLCKKYKSKIMVRKKCFNNFEKENSVNYELITKINIQ